MVDRYFGFNTKLKAKVMTIKIKKLHLTKFFLLCLFSSITLLQFSFAASPPLQVTVLDFKPYAFKTTNGDIKGMLPELTELIMNEAGFRYELSLAPFARIREELKSGSKEISFLILSDSIRQVAECVEPISIAKTVIISTSGKYFETIEDLYGLKNPVAGVRGAKYGKLYDENKNILKIDNNSYSQNINMLFLGRVSAIIGVEEGIYKAAKDLGFAKDNFGQPLVLSEKKNCVFFSKKTFNKRQKEIQKLQGVINSLRQDGQLNSIINKWFSAAKVQ